ncbi:hypothetical protein D3C87_163490 [compost metagenome]
MSLGWSNIGDFYRTLSDVQVYNFRRVLGLRPNGHLMISPRGAAGLEPVLARIRKGPRV